jgi:hypothetical protein
MAIEGSRDGDSDRDRICKLVSQLHESKQTSIGPMGAHGYVRWWRWVRHQCGGPLNSLNLLAGPLYSFTQLFKKNHSVVGEYEGCIGEGLGCFA